MFGLPRHAAAPFAPSAIRGSVGVSADSPLWQRWLRMAGPGLLVSVGYMDPGNWATDIEGGAKYGYALLWMVLLSSLAAIALQAFSLRLGLVARKDLARACRERYRPSINRFLWLMAEVAIVACDVAEVLGSGLALHLLLGVSLLVGIAITAFDTLIVLAMQGSGFRRVEAIVLVLVLTIAGCFAAELAMVGLDWGAVARGFIPHGAALRDPKSLFLSVGILGATVMPHNLYLHSSIVQTRDLATDERSTADALRLSTFDTVTSLSMAFLVNAAILALAAAAFHDTGHEYVADIQDAYHLLDPLVGGSLASLLFGVALLASGQSSTLTGTIAGQILLEGFLDLKIPCWQQRLITRALALVPAFGGVLWLGQGAVGKLLVASQVVLSFQLPFAIWPLLRLTGDRNVMGRHANGPWLATLGWSLFIVITGANIFLLSSLA